MNTVWQTPVDTAALSNGAPAWFSVDFNGSWTESDLTDLAVGITADDLGPGEEEGEKQHIQVIYAEINP